MTNKTSYHTTQSGADLQGPLTESEFIQSLERSYETRVEFANRAKSNRASNHLSYLGRGYVIAQVTELGWILLYDSVQNPEAYMARLPGRCWVAGRHQIDQYWVQKVGPATGL